MYLSRLMLNTRSVQVRRELGDCHQLHRTVMCGFPDLPAEPAARGDARARLGVLFRLEVHPRTGAASLLVQSGEEPDWSRLPPGYLLDSGGSLPNPEVKVIAGAFEGIRAGDELVFRLRANPTKRLPPTTGTDGIRRDGKRVEVQGEEQQLAWMGRKGEASGFRLVSVRARPGLTDVRPGFVPPDGDDAAARPRGRLRGWHDADCRTAKATGGRLVATNGGGAGRRERLTFGDVLFEGRLVVTDAELFRTTLRQGIGSGKAYGFGLLSVARAPA